MKWYLKMKQQDSKHVRILNYNTLGHKYFGHKDKVLNFTMKRKFLKNLS